MTTLPSLAINAEEQRAYCCISIAAKEASMTEYADLELGIHRWDAESYAIELRFTQPDSDADVRLARGSTPSLLRIDPAKLRELSIDSAAYGRYLGECLFADAEVRTRFAQARAASQSLGAPLRMRLFIGASAAELHAVRWETLHDDTGAPLLMSEHILFSRYLTSGDWQPVRLRPRGSLRALALIANPSDLGDYHLGAVDVAGELERVRAGLGDIALTTLAESGQATLDNLLAALREANNAEEPYDILYIVAHGALVMGDSWLWLENADGKTARVAGNDLTMRLSELRQRPRLVALAACQTSGKGAETRSADEGALAALGPRLAEAGIPAVIAMQGSVFMDTIATFMPVFFIELSQDGQIDRALALARGAVRDHADYWMPVLFMRLRSGRIWYVPGFGEEGESFEKWPALVRSIQRGQCTPVIGTHMSESFLGSSRDIAQNWADTYNFPMAPHEREDLPQVAQYLSVNQDYQFPHEELIEHLHREMANRYGNEISPEARDGTLDEMFAAVGTLTRERNPSDPFKVLAELPLSIYVTANASNLLTEALRAAGKEPQVELCRWNEEVEMLPSIYDDDPDYQPDEQRPLVYHLFGIFEHPESLVLTEDDYFDFLIGISENKELIPISVRQALADTALLFLGFRLDDWGFRVLFRSLMSQEGRRRRRKYAHVAGQILPEEGRFLEPERARRYLENYFEDSDISIFWGSAADFTRELLEQMSAVAERRGSRRR